MIVVISGTNRPECNTLKVARLVTALAQEGDRPVKLLNLQELPPEIFQPTSYAEKPEGFAPFQQAISEASGIITVTPEYNGSFPGVLKYFVDMLKFPESLVGIPAAFVGLGAGEWGGLRSVEQLAIIYQYRSAHLFGRRVFLKHIHKLLDDSGAIQDSDVAERLANMVREFVAFSERTSAS